MKMRGRAADFCGTKEKRGKKEERISMMKKANAFFFPGSHFLFLPFFPHNFHRNKEGTVSTTVVDPGEAGRGCGVISSTLPANQ